jgi:hypothetical protein
MVPGTRFAERAASVEPTSDEVMLGDILKPLR